MTIMNEYKVSDVIEMEFFNETVMIILLYKYDLFKELDVQKYIADYMSVNVNPTADLDSWSWWIYKNIISQIKNDGHTAWLYLTGDYKFLTTEEALNFRKARLISKNEK